MLLFALYLHPVGARAKKKRLFSLHVPHYVQTAHISCFRSLVRHVLALRNIFSSSLATRDSHNNRCVDSLLILTTRSIFKHILADLVASAYTQYHASSLLPNKCRPRTCGAVALKQKRRDTEYKPWPLDPREYV